MARILPGQIDETNLFNTIRQIVIKLNEIEASNKAEIARLKQELSRKIDDTDNKIIAHFTDASYNERSSGIEAAVNANTVDASGVIGTLAISQGGTGQTTNPSMLTNLGTTSAANVFQASPRPGVTGTLPVANGGTGKSSNWANANAVITASSTTALGNGVSTASGAFYATSTNGAPSFGTLPVAQGGTGRANVTDVRNWLFDLAYSSYSSNGMTLRCVVLNKLVFWELSASNVAINATLTGLPNINTSKTIYATGNQTSSTYRIKVAKFTWSNSTLTFISSSAPDNSSNQAVGMYESLSGNGVLLL